MAEGILLANYAYHGQKQMSEKDAPSLLESVNFITASKNAHKVVDKAETICEGVYFARDLINGNADDVTPGYLTQVAVGLSKKHPKIHTTIFDKKKLEKEGFGLILAVSRGSHHDPVMIVAEYKGNPKDKKATVLIGKGVTYDTGGLNLKPTGSMETMKCDMGGAAVVLGVLDVAAQLNLKQNITVVVPSVENSISSMSYKPGDVYKSYSGKTVEIGNTDAEGRLILADALAYAVKKLNPKEIVDVATLTGAIEVALGNECSGLFCNNDVLADALLRSGRITFERVWRMPLFDEYKEQLRSDIADMSNHGGRSGGAVTAALFLKEFIDENIPWAHLDIAATAYLKDKKRYHPKSGTGIGVRLLIEMIESL
jgi:leucyl aminopeptidase